MSASTFIDTNVFVYQLDGSDPRKHAIAGGIVRDSLASKGACSARICNTGRGSRA